MFNKWWIIFIVFITINIRGQPIEIISTMKPLCYTVNDITVSTMVENVESAINKKLSIKKDFDIVFYKNKVFYFYKSILWRMEVKNVKLDCEFQDNEYWNDNIKVLRDKNNVYITDINIWVLILERNKKPTKVKRTDKL